MLRVIRCAPLLVLSLPGCFSEPSEVQGTANGSTTIGTSSTSAETGVAPTTAALTTGGDSGTTFVSDTFGSGSTFSGEATFASAGTDDGSTTGPDPSMCDCPVEAFFCETFDEFDNGQFPNWTVPSPGEPPQQVVGQCGNAFRGEIGPGEQFAVLSRRQLNVLDGKGVDGVRVRGLIHISPDCAELTRHRLVSARTDTGAEGYLYSAEIELDEGSLVLLQRSNDPDETTTQTIGPAPLETWVPFEIELLGLTSANGSLVRARIGETMVQEPRIPFPTEQLSFSIVPGPFAYLEPAKAGCTADFDNIAVQQILREP